MKVNLFRFVVGVLITITAFMTGHGSRLPDITTNGDLCFVVGIALIALSFYETK